MVYKTVLQFLLNFAQVTEIWLIKEVAVDLLNWGYMLKRFLEGGGISNIASTLL